MDLSLTRDSEFPADLSPLAWVQEELRRTLEAVHKSLRRLLRDVSDTRSGTGFGVSTFGADASPSAALQTAAAQLHQVAGVLQLVGLPAGAVVLRASELVLQQLVQEPSRVEARTVEVVERAHFALLSLIARLLAAAPAGSPPSSTSTLALFPTYRELQSLNQAERVHPADLWQFDWQWLTLPAEAGIAPLPAASVRSGFEATLLAQMRTPAPESARLLSDLCAAIAAGLDEPHARLLWQLAAAQFEAQALKLLPVDALVKRLGSRLLMQLRKPAEPGQPGEAALQRLAQDLLFFCASARLPAEGQTAPRLAAVRAGFGLPAEPLATYEDESLGRIDPNWVAQARRRVSAAKESWGSVAEGETSRFPVLEAQFAALAESLQRLFPDGQVLGSMLQRAVVATLRAGQAPVAALAMEVATSLLYVDAALEEASFDRPEQAERVRRLAQRIEAASHGQDSEPLEAWMEELYRRVSDRQTLGSVVQELRASLQEVERRADAYFRQPAQRELLIPVPAQLSTMRGVLTVLGLSHAAQACLHMRDEVDELANTEIDTERAAPRELFDRLANNLSALSFLIDMLSVQPHLAKQMFRFDEASGLLSPVMGRREASRAAQPQAPVEPRLPEPAEAAPVLEAAPEPALVADPEPEPVLDLDFDLDGLAQALNEPPPEPVSFEPVSFEWVDPVEPLQTSQTPAPLAVPEALELAQAHGDGDGDGEMLGVFLEEAQEVLASAQHARAELERQPAAREALGTVRRAFHTLKGSARMVGQADFGEAAWACEQLFNQALESPADAPAALLAFAGEALDYLAEWRDEMASLHSFGDPSPSGLRHQAEPVRRSADALRLGGQLLPLEWPASALSGLDELELDLEPQPAPEPSPEPEHPAPPAPPAAPVLTLVSSQAHPPLRPELESELEPEPEAVEEFKLIGDLRISIARFNQFLSEADELSRRLAIELAEWALELSHSVPTQARELAQALIERAAGVGFEDLVALTRELELALARAQAARDCSAEQAELFVSAADDIRRLLHQFAAGFLKPVDPARLAQLQAYQPQAAQALSLPAAPLAEAPVVETDVEAALPADDVLDPELLPIFEQEAAELLRDLHASLREWQAQPQSGAAAAAAAMRLLHTFKGGARLCGALSLGEQAHELESVIEQLGAKDLLQAADVPALQERADALESGLEALLGREPQRAELLSAEPPPVELPAADPAHPESEPEPEPEPELQAPAEDAGETATATAPLTGIDWSRFAAEGDAAPAADAAELASPALLRVRAPVLERMAAQAGEVSIRRSRMESELAQMKSSLLDLDDNLDRLRGQLRELELQAQAQAHAHSAAPQDAQPSGHGFDPLEFDRYTRLQELSRMLAESVGDVATVQRSLQRNVQLGEDEMAAQSRLTRELQDDLLRTRMVEFDSLAERLHRVVRQAARELGKQVQLQISGTHTELDRSVLERMAGAFEHLLRNGVAHGIEAPEARAAAGKPPVGTIHLDVKQEGNEILLDFADDGAGLDLPRIRARGLQQGLIKPGAEPDDQALMQLIFAPGFSTAAQLSELAGRGVGMDVVRAAASTLGGSVEIASAAGQGSHFLLRLPLTTALTQVVVVRCGEQTMAVPAGLLETVIHLPPADLQQAFATGVLVQGGEQRPFYGLGALLGLKPPAGPARACPVLLLRGAQQRLALQVDELLGNQEVVVKNLGPQLSRVPGLAGISLLASGEVALIYNPVALAHGYGEPAQAAMRVVAEGQAEPGAGAGADPAAAAEAPPAALVLVVDDSLTVRRVTQRLLEREGYRVALAKDGQEALTRLEEGELPALLLSDIEMPRMDGFDLVRNMKAQPRLAALPVVMITSRIAPKHRELALALGVNHYLGKPYDEDELLGLLARLTTA